MPTVEPLPIEIVIPRIPDMFPEIIRTTIPEPIWLDPIIPIEIPPFWWQQPGRRFPLILTINVAGVATFKVPVELAELEEVAEPAS